jgi:hypothetical protein
MPRHQEIYRTRVLLHDRRERREVRAAVRSLRADHLGKGAGAGIVLGVIDSDRQLPRDPFCWLTGLRAVTGNVEGSACGPVLSVLRPRESLWHGCARRSN